MISERIRTDPDPSFVLHPEPLRRHKTHLANCIG